MAQNAISGKLKLKNFLGELISRLPAFGNYWILKLYDSIQDPFRCPSTECLQTPLRQLEYRWVSIALYLQGLLLRWVEGYQPDRGLMMMQCIEIILMNMHIGNKVVGSMN